MYFVAVIVYGLPLVGALALLGGWPWRPSGLRIAMSGSVLCGCALFIVTIDEWRFALIATAVPILASAINLANALSARSHARSR